MLFYWFLKFVAVGPIVKLVFRPQAQGREHVPADGAAILGCDAADKQALLRTLIAIPLDIGTVQPMRAATLEETYLKHAGVL